MTFAMASIFTSTYHPFFPIRMRPARTFFISLLLAFAVASIAAAGCKSDCRDEYDFAVDSCKLLHDDPDDADDLQSCIRSAKDDYDMCIEECDD